MAQLWRVREGREPTGSESRWLSLPVDACVQKLNLSKSDFVKSYPSEGELPVGPQFGEVNDVLARFREPTLLVIEIETEEARVEGWDAGFYLVPLSLSEAEKCLSL